MKIYGTYQRLCMGGWILGAFLILAYNGFQMLALEGRPITGFSPAIKAIESKLIRFNQLSGQAAAPVVNVQNQTAFFNRYSRLAPITPSSKTPSQSASDPSGIKNTQDVSLPELAGIIHIRDPQGHSQHKALINGKFHIEKDRIEGFVIKKITDTKVVLLRQGRQYTIQSPNPHYSRDLGE